VVYRIDSGISRFTVRAFATGMLSAFAHNPTFAVRQYEGDVQFDGNGTGALTLSIEAPSLELTDDVSSKDQSEIQRIMHQDVLDDATFPTITYDSQPSTTVIAPSGDVTMNGELMLHGVKRRQPITARLVASPGMIRAYGEFSIKQTDYGIKPFVGAGGAIKVKDELKCTFDITARS
jgi:polyisoprenoid-binding protein YceI